jgi:hypothetical protein
MVCREGKYTGYGMQGSYIHRLWYAGKINIPAMVCREGKYTSYVMKRM